MGFLDLLSSLIFGKKETISKLKKTEKNKKKQRKKTQALDLSGAYKLKQEILEECFQEFNENIAKYEYDLALLNIEKAIDLDKDNAIHYYNKGTLLYRIKRDEEAIPCLEKAISLKSGKVTIQGQTIKFEPGLAHFNLAMLYFHTGNYKKSRKHAEMSEKLKYGLEDLKKLYKEIERLEKENKSKEYNCYKCGVNASKEGYMCNTCAKEAAQQMKDGTYQLKDEKNENIKNIVENLIKEPEIIEKYSYDSDNETYYQLLDKKIDNKFNGEIEHVLFEGDVIAHIEAIHKVKGNYKNGIRDGVFQLLYTQGNLANETCYRKGVKHGAEKMYFVSGNIVNEWNYKNGVEHGPRIQYFESGQVEIHSILENGKIQGLMKGYNENGDLLHEDMYKDDMPDGEQKYYHHNGKLAQVSNEKMGKRHGITIEYYDDGQIKSLGRYKNGNLLGSVIKYDKIDNNKISAFNKYIEKSTSLQSTKLLKQIDIKWLKNISVFDGSTISNIEQNELVDKDGLHLLLNVPIYIKGESDAAAIVISNHDIEEAKFTIDGIVNELSEESSFELIKDKDYCYESEDLIISYMIPLKSITIELKK